MANFDFDFHRRGTVSRKAGLALALLGSVVLGLAWNGWETARARSAGLALQIAELEQQAARVMPRRAAPADQAFGRVASQLEYRWQPAFDALARARSAKVALVSLDAVQAKSQVKLVAEARELADAVAFVDALQQQPGVARAALFQHEVQAEPAEHPVRFTVVVELGA